MAYFVVERSRDDGTLTIPLPDAYETRDAAITALAAATSSGTISLQGEVFIADLGSAVPVLVMPSAPAAAEVVPADIAVPEHLVEAVEEPDVESVEAAVDESEEPGELDEAGSDSAFTTWEPLGEITAAESTLADALKRAATSLEDEGIVAPDSIVSAAETVAEEPSDAEESEEQELPSAGDTETDTAAWPWANVESYEIKVESTELLESDDEVLESESVEVTAKPEDARESEVVADVEPGIQTEVVPEEQPIITSAPAEGEEAYMPHPVILGDYLDSVSAAVEGEPEVPAEPAEPEASVQPEASDESVSEDGEELDLSEAEEPAEPAEASAEPAGADVDEIEAIEAALAEHADASVPDVGYEATGELKLEEYTCQDCVYSNTCPKVGQTTPAECGSFQWRSE